MREPELLPVVGGTLNGEERAYLARGWMIEVLDVTMERYVVVQDDTGARFWQLAGLVPLSHIAA